MASQRTPNVHTHRIRHRRRLSTSQPDFSRRQKKLDQHLTLAAAEMNAIVGVAGVTNAEVLTSIEANATINPVGARDIRARDQRGLTAIAQVEAVGIPIA